MRHHTTETRTLAAPPLRQSARRTASRLTLLALLLVACGSAPTPPAVPTVSLVAPNRGSTAGATTVTITGTHFTAASTVTFGPVAASHVTYVDSTTLKADSPASPAGTVDISVTTAAGSSAITDADHFTYVDSPAVTALTPTEGPRAGGTTVTITGTHFAPGATVTFGALPATSVTVVNDTTITAVSPAGQTGSVDVVVSSSGNGATSPTAQFTYLEAPTVSAISPREGPLAGGTAVTITGTNFTSNSTVRFGTQPAQTVNVLSATALVATAPAGIGGTVNLTVTTAGGRSSATTAEQFTYVQAPTLTRLTPTVGTSAGGVTVTLTGTHFTPGMSVRFGGVPATGVTVLNDTTLTAVSPAGRPGLVDVTVTTTGGRSGPQTFNYYRITEYQVPTHPSHLTGLTSGPDGNIWFTEERSNKIGRITPGGTLTEFPIDFLPGGLMDITTGSDGNLWFTSTYGAIGRITPGGAYTVFLVPGGFGTPRGITSGPDGNLWYTDLANNQIGRVTTAGVFKTYPLPSPNGGPADITVGPDGNLWFTEIDANRIGRITPGGTITEFTVPTANSVPGGITGGPDGNVWFTESFGHKVARITPAGTITEFEVPNALPTGITTGPDGNLWFTENGGTAIGRLTPAGVVTEFVTPTLFSNPLSITTGPDGNLWFTESTTDQIAVLEH
ncbi:IPT/TIG domain-containing protein [Deinococcus yunweiensis]|uniref:virginiamycin B lyase family protein n=1 Tax=Deinococcus yunweiensis TaxID=367282 RepID=UPI00398F6E88